MKKALSILLVLVFAAYGFGQKKPARGKRPAAQQPAAVTPQPEPSPTPVDPDADRSNFDAALAAPATAEKARLLKQFLNDFPDSALREEAYSYLVSARATVAGEMLQAGNADAGVASFKLAVEEAPTPVPDGMFANTISKIPANLFYRDQRPAAMELAQLIEKKVAADAKQLLTLAAFYLGIENGADARRVAEAAIAVDPASAAGYQALGLAHRLNFDLDESAKAYAKAAELDAGSVSARRSLAEMNRALGKPDEAAAIYREILAANDGDAPARQGLVLALFDGGRQKEAETELARVLPNETRNFGLLTSVAYWYALNEQPDKAIEFAQKSIDAEPRYIWGHIVLARGLMKKNKPVDAERTLIKARQYGTAMREMDALQKQIAAFETQVLERMTGSEEVEKELEERAEEINTIDAKRAAALKQFDSELKKNRTAFDTESKARAVVFDTLPAQLASVYNRLAQRSRDGIAVAEVVNGSCSACFMSLRPQMQVEVRKGQQIITCESCTRILYIPSKLETSEATAS